MDFRIRDLRGARSLRALNAFNTLVLGLKMLPAYLGQEFEAFLDTLHVMTDEDKEKCLREALMFVNLDDSEVETICSFAEDKNGVPFTPERIKHMDLTEIFDIVIGVCMRISKIRVDFITENEKKK